MGHLLSVRIGVQMIDQKWNRVYSVNRKKKITIKITASERVDRGEEVHLSN